MRLAGNLHAELLLAFFLRGAGAVSSFVLIWLTARSFGAVTVGLLQIAIATATLAAVFVSQGLDRIIVRVASIAIADGRLGDAAVTYRQARNRLLLGGVIVTLVVLVGADPFARHVLHEPAAVPFLWLLAPVSMAIAVIRLCASVLRSKGRVVLSQSLDGVAYTTFAAVVLGAAVLAGRADWPLLPAAAYLGGTMVILGVAIWQCHVMIRGWGTGTAVLPTVAGLYVAAFIGLSTAADWVGIMLLTYAEGAASTGIYRVAHQITMLFIIVNASFAIMVSPRIASAGARGDHVAVKKTVRTAGMLGTLICAPLFAIIMIWPTFILGLFGSEFEIGVTALRILAVSQLINVAFGPVGASLTMMHQERSVLLIELFAFVLSIGVVLATLPTFGMVALAIGSVVSSLTRNAGSYLILRRHMQSGMSVPVM